MRENFTYGSMRGCWRRSYGADCDTGATAKAAGQPKPPFLWPPRQRPTLQKRNVVDHLPEQHKADVKRRLQNAYAMADYAEAKRALEKLHRELMDLNPSAARSLEEGLEETLTVHKLRVPDQLRRTLCCTNVIESAFSIVETVCRNVKRWQVGDQIERPLGGLGAPGCTKTVPKGHRTQTDSGAHQRIRSAGRPRNRKLSKKERCRRVGCTGAASFNGDSGIPAQTQKDERIWFRLGDGCHQPVFRLRQQRMGHCVRPNYSSLFSDGRVSSSAGNATAVIQNSPYNSQAVGVAVHGSVSMGRRV